MPSVGIVGAGLVGCLAALAFEKKGYDVTLIELRRDPELEDKLERNLRSINLAVSDRGIRALKYVDENMADRILQFVIPMKGRMIHDPSGLKQESQLYGLFGEHINSIDRSYLNEHLLREIKKAGITCLFEHKLVKLTFDGKSNLSTSQSVKLTVLDTRGSEAKEKVLSFDYSIGADGAHSQFRYQMQKSMRMNISQEYIDMFYLELKIPPTNQENKFAIDANHLHIWPRHNHMLIALANEDGSFTSTFFGPWSIAESLGNSGNKFVNFFKQNFPDAYSLIGEASLVQAFKNNPRGSLMQVGTSPYHHPSGRALIIGDAAHLMVPFYGQGMNCGFEDVHVLMELLDDNQGNIPKTFAHYSSSRKKDIDAICKLALDNYHEMSSKVTSPVYLLRKKIDHILGKFGTGKLYTWIPLYTMISFRGDIPYSRAIEIEKKQRNILNIVQLGAITTLLPWAIFKSVNLWDKWVKRS